MEGELKSVRSYPRETASQMAAGEEYRPPVCVFSLETQAMLVHEANRAWQKIIGEANVSPPWAEAPLYQRESMMQLVTDFAGGRGKYGGDPGRDNHDKWMSNRLRAGWRYGETKDEAAKTHPCLLPYAELPPEQKMKDHLAQHVLTALHKFTKQG